MRGKVVSVMDFGCFVSIGDNTDGLVHISQLQVLCHQYKIPSRVELYTSTDATNLSNAANATFKRLGHFSLDPNTRSRFRARELKTVYAQVRRRAPRGRCGGCAGGAGGVRTAALRARVVSRGDAG